MGNHIPVPIVDTSVLENQAQGGFLDLLSLFSGGGIGHFSVFSLGIMPYITSSIIIQLMTVVIPKLAQWQDQGEAGTKKINQTTRYVTVALAFLQSAGLVFLFHNGASQNIPDLFTVPGSFKPTNVLLIVLVMTAGTALIMWLGELITQRGIGNGMSILIFASVVSRLPAQGGAVFAEAGWFKGVVVIGVGIAMITGIVYVESGQRRIPVQFAKRVVGRRMYGGQSTYIPLKVNQSGVIPVIFASSILAFPALIASATNWTGLQNFANDNLVKGNSWIYIGLFSLMILFFAYFYTAIAFNPQQQADVIRKQGGFIPGIRPGPPTEKYLAKVLNRITLPGAIFLMIIALVPLLVFKLWNISQFPFGGTALLITVGVALETMKQIDSQLMMRNYEGFLA